ncbi:hypothetical protein [Liquorilactobacillus ghanensis]|uniref:hypothetical protein n=1 Tax=Liquorilactobacillus ghanensis TaxID=399370 RepID=UPI0039ECF868
MFKKLFNKHKQENEHEFQDAGMNHIGHGGITHDADKEAIIPITKASGQRASDLLQHVINQFEYRENEIRIPKVNEVINDINDAILSNENGNGGVLITLNEYRLNPLEEKYVLNELRQAGWNYGLMYGGNRPAGIEIYFEESKTSKG